MSLVLNSCLTENMRKKIKLDNCLNLINAWELCLVWAMQLRIVSAWQLEVATRE